MRMRVLALALVLTLASTYVAPMAIAQGGTGGTHGKKGKKKGKKKSKAASNGTGSQQSVSPAEFGNQMQLY
jgi:hypothetical protein